MLATVAEAQKDRVEREQWDTTAQLLALVAELIDLGNRNFVAVHSKKGSQIPDPIQIDRPGPNGASSNGKRKATAAEMKAFFGGAVTYTP